jgi:hypothetical protein
MSHITFKTYQFILIIHLWDYHYDFDLDIVGLVYGVLLLSYTTYQNICPSDHCFGRLLMSQDVSPTWVVLLESISDYPGIFFSFLPCLKKVLWFDSLCPFLIILILLNYLFLVRSSCSENLNFLAFFIFSSGPSASFANCKLTSVDSACLNTQFWFIACCRRRRRRHCIRRSRFIRLAACNLSYAAAVCCHCQ